MSPAWWDKLGLGVRLVRPAQLYPVAAPTQMFTAVGKVCLTSIIGEVQVAAIGGTCGNCSLVTEATDIATAVAIANDPVGQMYSVATIGGALNVAAPFTDLYQPIILWDTDQIGITITTNPTDNGQIQWTIRYHPMTVGAYVALA